MGTDPLFHLNENGLIGNRQIHPTGRPLHGGMFLLDFIRGGQAAHNKKIADSRRNVGFRLELLVTGEKIPSSGDIRSWVVKIQMCCHRKPHQSDCNSPESQHPWRVACSSPRNL